MNYVVFITTCKQTNLYFIGLHKQANDLNVFDGYLGDSVWQQKASTFKYPKSPFQFAVKRYGSDQFTRIDLAYFTEYSSAYQYYIKLFCNNNRTYNIQPIDNHKIIYQFNLDGKLIKNWTVEEAVDFYGYPYAKIKQSILTKTALCNSFWSDISEINVYEYDTKPIHYIYIYNEQGKCVDILGSLNQVCEILNIPIKEVLEHINKQILCNNYYISYKLLDVYKPKIRRQLKDEKYYVYDLQGKLIKECFGKEVMNVIRCHSWKKIHTVIQNGGYYYEYFISHTPVDKLPPKKEHRADIYDKYGNPIESVTDLSILRNKYGLTNAQIKRMQLGDKYFNDYIIKYNK